MKPRHLAWLSGGLFLLSHLLPAYLDERGFGCFTHCLGIFFSKKIAEPGAFLGWLYYSGFVVTNLAFVAVWLTGLITDRYLKTRFILSTLAFFHVTSWLLYNLFNKSDDPVPLQSGYYIWLLAYALLVTVQVLPARQPAPPSSSV